MLTKELKKELLGLIPDWQDSTTMSNELYDLLFKWSREIRE